MKTNVKPSTPSSKNSLNPDGTVNLSSLGGEYDFNGQNLSIRTVNIKKNPTFIADTKRKMENSKKRYLANDNFSEIYTTKVNGNECLISRNNGGGVQQNYYVFYVVNKEITSYVTGMLMFSPGQESLAKENLANILKGIKMN
ncbi:hypothetical protein ACFSNA_02635 [Pedobacter mendelii]|uniref:hypothetical protein n=1 Tax=Pedobacter mendelii TaxID=1908240 RepID=UPI0036239CD5